MGHGTTSSQQFIRTKQELETYVGRNFREYTSELVQAVRDMCLVDPTEPEIPDGAVGWAAQEKWKRADKEYHKRLKAYVDFRAGLYQIVWGQCTVALRTKLESLQEFDKAFQDGIALLRLLQTVVHTFEKRANQFYEVSRMKESYYTLKQGQSETLHNYHKRIGFQHKSQIMIVFDSSLSFSSSQ
jgi:hypothetical protein